MAVVFVLGLIFHYLDDFYVVFKRLEETQRFGAEFDNVCTDLGVGVNGDKKQLGCIVDFLGLEFDTVKMEARLPKDKLEEMKNKEVPLPTRNCNLLLASFLLPLTKH